MNGFNNSNQNNDCINNNCNNTNRFNTTSNNNNFNNNIGNDNNKFKNSNYNNNTIVPPLRDTTSQISRNMSEGKDIFNNNRESKNTFQEVDETSETLSKERFAAFRTIVMTLLYVARRTRPDIIFHVTWLTSRMTVATNQDMAKLNHLLMYLNGTKLIGMRLVPEKQSSAMIALVDSSHGLHQSGHGHWGLVIKLHGMTVLAMSRKLKLVTRSSCESEILGVNEAGVYILFLKEFLESLGLSINTPVPIYQDNESCIGILQGDHKIAMSSKHMHLRTLWVMDYIKRLIFVMRHLDTKRLSADMLGKSLCGLLFRRHRYGIMKWPGTKPYEDFESVYDEK